MSRRRILLEARALILLRVHQFRSLFFRGSRFRGSPSTFRRLGGKAMIQAGKWERKTGRELQMHIRIFRRDALVVRGPRRGHIVFPDVHIVFRKRKDAARGERDDGAANDCARQSRGIGQPRDAERSARYRSSTRTNRDGPSDIRSITSKCQTALPL